ncbi:MAG TPA: ATP-binding protein [Acidimicrobiia bacterium]|nr:ATP-binding protein [Acidimicrobiia bacterium]
MSSRSEPGRAPFAVRLFFYYGLVYVVLIGIIGWLVLESAEVSPEHRNSMLLTFVAGGLLGLVVVWLLARWMAAPIAALTDHTLDLIEGEGEGVPRSQVRELDQLGLAISRLEAGQRERVVQAEHATETLEMVLGALRQGTVLFSQDDQVVYANSSAQRLLGSVPNSLSGLAPFPFQNAVRESRETQRPVERAVEHGKPVRRLRAVATPFSTDNRILLVVVDVTDLDRVASIRRDFVANASHELKTPVSAIIASSEALQIAVLRHDDSSLGFAQQIERSARQLDRLVGDLLDLSRLERDQPELEPLSLDLLVREELERLRPVAEEKAIELSMELAPTQIAGSRRDIAIAARNLLDNAIRYTGAGGSVGAVLSTVNGEVVLRISDTGEGIPTRDLSRVFERFYRVDAARSRSTGGTGLGLAIVKHVVESHGGSVDVESELGRGSVFTVRLPVLDGDNVGPSLA